MKNAKLVLPLLAAALCACAELQHFDLSAATGGRVSNDTLQTVNRAGIAARSGFADISESEEYFIGRSVAAQILGRYTPLDDPKLNFYVQRVAQSVAMASDRPATFKGYHVQVLDSDEVNAFAAPGGFIFVTKGLLKLVHTEDELACVLAHEVAHVAKKHGLQAIKSSRLTSAFALLGTAAAQQYTSGQVAQLTTAFSGTVDDVVKSLVTDGYSRSKEYEADKFGAQYARNANYDPRALKTFLTRMDQAGAAQGGGMFKTHPKASKRVDALGDLSPSNDYRPSPARDKRFSAFVNL